MVGTGRGRKKGLLNAPSAFAKIAMGSAHHSMRNRWNRARPDFFSECLNSADCGNFRYT